MGVDKALAEKLRRACRKERKAFNELCDNTEDAPDACANYLKAKASRKRLEAKVESA